MRFARHGVWLLGAAVLVHGCSNDPEPGMMMVPMLGTSGAGAAAVAGSGAAGGAAGAPVTSGTAGSSAGGGGAGSGAAGSGGALAAGGGGSAAGAGGAAAAGSGGAAGATAGTGAPAAGGGGSTAGAGGAAGAAGAMSMRQKSPCLKNGSQVVFLGDSYVNYAVTHPLLSTLVEERARADGALPAGQTYRSYAVPGTTLASPNPLLGTIPPQWDQAVGEDPDITTVIMTGGGNDVLINNPHCLEDGAPMDPSCQMVVAETLRVGRELITKMREHGVSDGIYFFYPHVPAGGDDINDYSLAMLKMQSASLGTDTFHTYVLDLIPVFEGHPEYFASDGIHANAVGEGVIADEIYEIMKANCIAQPESKGCCMP